MDRNGIVTLYPRKQELLFLLDNEEEEGDDISLVDLGIVNVVDLLAGPQTLITPAAGTALWPIPDPTGYVQGDSGDVSFVPSSRATIVEIQAPLLIWNCDNLFYDGAFVNPTNTWWVTGCSDGFPVKAYFETNFNAYPLLGPAAAWQANHVYPASVVIITGNDGHLWSQSAGGTSGATIPDFAGNEGGTVVDNGVTWQDEGAIPTIGSLHLLGLVASL